jgi:outer membrane protein
MRWQTWRFLVLPGVGLLALVLILHGGAPLLAQEPAPMTLKQAIATALGTNPDGTVSKTASDEAVVNKRLARTALFPSVQFQESISRGNDPVYVFGTKLRQQVFTQNDFSLNSLNRPQPLNNFATQFSGSWTAFDSWHTEFEMHRADLLSQSTSASQSRTDQEIELRTIRAYATVSLSIAQQETAKHETETAKALLNLSSTRVRAGLAVDADELSARAYLAEREEEEIAAEGAVRVAWAELEAATGRTIPTNEEHLATLSGVTFPQMNLSDETTLALKSRPDRKSLSLQGEAAKSAVRSAESAYGPQVRAYGNWEMDKDSFAGSGGNNWVAGVEVRVDLLPAAKRESVALSKIAVNRSNAMQTAADREIQMEVTRAFYDHQAAEKMMAVAQASTDQTVESLRTLQDRYQAGLSTMTELMRTEDAERRSRTNYSQAVFRNALTYAVLRFADGTINQEIAGELQ